METVTEFQKQIVYTGSKMTGLIHMPVTTQNAAVIRFGCFLPGWQVLCWQNFFCDADRKYQYIII